MLDGTTSVLSVSRAGGLDCARVADALLRCGVPCVVVTNASVVQDPKTQRCAPEQGCTVTLTGLRPDLIGTRVWDVLKPRFGLTCAHLSIPGRFNGCIYDFIRPSACPANN